MRGNPDKITAGQRALKLLYPTSGLLAFSVAAIALFLVWQHTLLKPHLVDYGLAHYSEWLLNYAGGFIRRGLAGAMLHKLSASEPAIGIVNLLVFANFAVLTVGLAALATLATRRTHIVALAMLLPGSVLSMAIGNDYYYRKEVLFHAHLVVMALVICTVAAGKLQNAPPIKYKIIAGCLAIDSVLLSLVHEAFLFVSLPAHLLLLRAVARDAGASAQRITGALICLGIAMFGIAAIFKGSAETPMAIWQSLHDVDRQLIHPENPAIPREGGMAAIGWPVTRALGEVALVFVSGYAWFWIVPFAFISFAAWLLCRLVADELKQPPEAAWHYFDNYLIIVASSLPMYVIAIDWGRWISSSFLEFAIVLLCLMRLDANRNRSIEATGFSQSIAYNMGRLLSKFAPISIVPLVLIVGFFVKMPECCIVGYNETLLTRLISLLKNR